ncbi:hydroxyproline-rich glycoprotein family protein [Striga asiatica]|uniref:Hydroxyproline-rich glycoprotein family protein n=1 Tax=Striga asiatica TaxID=4170 RepID=A0A5A7NW75_STRAF|nr:hydroxyproline-rich glycoprotein family protein [Striga asiatica]
MPKGSKKRKSAKKKMDIQSDSARPVGEEDVVKHNEERDNDVSEVSSPASQDHHNPSTEVKLEEIQKKANEKPVQIEREFKIGHDEIETGKSHSGGSSTSSGSSSDDEGHGNNNGLAAEDDSSLVSDSAEPLSGKKTENIQSVNVEEVKIIPSVHSEKVQQLDDQVKVASVEDKIGASLIDQSIEKISTDFPLNVLIDTAAKESGNEKGSAVTQVLCLLPLFHLQCKRHHGKVVVDCLKCFQGLEDKFKKGM